MGSEKMARLCLLPLLVVLASVDCDRVPNEVTVSGRRYLCHYQHKDRDSAQKKCSSEGMTLLEVETKSLLQKVWLKCGYSDDVWLGGTFEFDRKIGIYGLWSNGKRVSKAAWAHGHPEFPIPDIAMAGCLMGCFQGVKSEFCRIKREFICMEKA